MKEGKVKERKEKREKARMKRGRKGRGTWKIIMEERKGGKLKYWKLEIKEC